MGDPQVVKRVVITPRGWVISHKSIMDVCVYRYRVRVFGNKAKIINRRVENKIQFMQSKLLCPFVMRMCVYVVYAAVRPLPCHINEICYY